MKPKLLFFILLINFFHVSAQQFGGIPSYMKWKQIDTDTARIIFTKGSEEQAHRIATIIHKSASDTTTALGNRLRKINIVLHNRTTRANGFVALGPFRSEFYLIPGSNIFDFGNLPWHENLALHEYRHVHQYNNFRNGISKVLSYLFGENGQALGNAMSVPDWFFEGDATHTETAFSPQGRGRQSYFLSGFNSLWLPDINYSWLKLRNGSMKDYVPNHYQLGYLLTNYGYLKYGPDFWGNVTRDASAFKGLVYPFQKAIKKYSGVDYKKFRTDALDFYKQKLGGYRDAPEMKNKTVTSYYFPRYINDSSMVYLKESYSQLPAFYIKDQEGEKRIALQSISNEEWFAYRNGQIVYTAYHANPRWGYVDQNDIMVLELSDRTTKRLTKNERYYTPDFSPSGSKIVAIRMNDELKTDIDILDAETGNLIDRVPAGPSDFYSNPRFIDEHRVVVGIRKDNATMSLEILDLRTKSFEVLIHPSFHSLGHPFVKRDTIYFTANFSGNDDIYAIRLKDKKTYQLTSGFAGNYFPSVHNDTLVWSHFTSNGMELRKKALINLAWGEINAMTLNEIISFYPVSFENNLLNTTDRRFSEKKYSRSTGLFRFHSWLPNYSDPEFTFSIYSDNILNTFSNELFYRYNQNESSHGIGWNTSYGGFLPMLNAGIEYTYGRSLAIPGRAITLDQFEARVGYNIPLNFTSRKTYRFLNFGSDYVFNRSMPTGIWKDSFQSANLTYLHHFVNWSHYLPSAIQHIYPKFGYTISNHYRHVVSENGFQYLFNGQVFLPSFRNHSLVFSASFQEVDTSNTVFSNRFSNSRGYEDYYFSRMWKLGVNYHFPILYPDFGFASIIYLQRLRGNIFYDLTRVYSFDKTQSRDFRSAGIEFFFDTKWWNQLPVSFGMRISHLLDDGLLTSEGKGSTWLEFILPVGLVTR